jgi:hypothetical protein
MMEQEHNICIWDENDTPWCPTTDDKCGKGLYKEAGGDGMVHRWDEVPAPTAPVRTRSFYAGHMHSYVPSDSNSARKMVQCIGLPEEGGGGVSRASEWIPPSFVPKKSGERAVGKCILCRCLCGWYFF